jgi:hypothetical protein
MCLPAGSALHGNYARRVHGYARTLRASSPWPPGRRSRPSLRSSTAASRWTQALPALRLRDGLEPAGAARHRAGRGAPALPETAGAPGRAGRPGTAPPAAGQDSRRSHLTTRSPVPSPSNASTRDERGRSPRRLSSPEWIGVSSRCSGMTTRNGGPLCADCLLVRLASRATSSTQLDGVGRCRSTYQPRQISVTP